MQIVPTRCTPWRGSVRGWPAAPPPILRGVPRQSSAPASPAPHPAANDTAAKREYGIRREIKTAADGSTQGNWMVAVNRRGGRVARSFSDDAYGGEEAARVTAEAWREAALRLIPPTTQLQNNTRVRRNNRSGVSGVIRDERRGVWEALVVRGDQRFSRRFLDKVHGEAQAKTLAIAARKELLCICPPDRFASRDPHATEVATRQFGQLLDRRFVADTPVSAVDPKVLDARIAALTAWFDRLRPRHVQVLLACYLRARGHYFLNVSVSDAGFPSQRRELQLALQQQTWQQRLPEAWAFVQKAITAQHSTARCKQFAARYQSEFLGSTPEEGLYVRYRADPPEYDEWRQPPEELRELLGDFEVPSTAALAIDKIPARAPIPRPKRPIMSRKRKSVPPAPSA